VLFAPSLTVVAVVYWQRVVKRSGRDRERQRNRRRSLGDEPGGRRGYGAVRAWPGWKAHSSKWRHRPSLDSVMIQRSR